MQRWSSQLKTRLAQLVNWLEHCTGIAAEFFIGFFRQSIIDYDASVIRPEYSRFATKSWTFLCVVKSITRL